MNAFERRQQILNILRVEHKLRVSDLSERFAVSDGTIRNDLDYLSDRNLIKRVHGGAEINDQSQILSPDYAEEARANSAIKTQIARWAAKTISDGDSIFLDASPTVFHMVPFLKPYRNLTIITTGIETALTLSKNTPFTVILMGGVVNAESVSVMGGVGECAFDQLHIKTAFVSCGAISVEHGLTEVDVTLADMKRRVVEHAQQIMVLVESNRFGESHVSSFASISDVTAIFTDDGLGQGHIDALRSEAPNLTLCGENQASAFTAELKDKRNLRIGFANLSEERPYAIFVRQGVEQAAQERGNIDLVLGDNRYQQATALRVAAHFVETAVDVAIEYHFDEELAITIVEQFRTRNIPVISVDLPVMGATYFGVDSYRAGYDGGAYLGEWIQRNWNGHIDQVVIVENTRSRVGGVRIKGQLDGIESVLGAVPEACIQRVGGASRMALDEVSALTQESLQHLANERHLVFLAFNDSTMEGILRGVAAAGREGDVVSIGMGAGTHFIRAELHKPASCLVAAILFQPEQYGQGLLELAERIAARESVPPAVYIQHTLIDHSNIATVYPNLLEQLKE